MGHQYLLQHVFHLIIDATGTVKIDAAESSDRQGILLLQKLMYGFLILIKWVNSSGVA